MEKRFNTKEASEKLKELGVPFTAGTLEVWRSQGRGPRFIRLARKVFYTESALKEFAKGQVVETNDSYDFGRGAEVA